MARNHRSTVIIDKDYKTFFHCDDYLHWAHRSDQVLHSTFILALEVKLQLALYQDDEGYDTDNIYDLLPMLKRAAHIHAVTTTNEGSINPSGSQGDSAFIPPLTLTGRAAGSPSYRLAWKCLNFDGIFPTIMGYSGEDEEEEYFPTASRDDESMSQRANTWNVFICIHMAPGKSEASCTTQTTTYPQQYIPKQAAAYPQKYVS